MDSHPRLCRRFEVTGEDGMALANDIRVAHFTLRSFIADVFTTHGMCNVDAESVTSGSGLFF